jgi:gliding motility-associated lipoprotein GldD
MKMNLIKKYFKSSITKFSNSLFPYFLISLFPFFIACNHDFTPKPRGYFRIDLPEKKYHVFSPENCPFEFEVPDYAATLPDTNRLSAPCWYDIYFKQFDGRIHLSYKPVAGDLNKDLEDSRTLAYKHAVKADGIDEQLIFSGDGKSSGIMYQISGNAASSVQFFLTDSVNHFMRGALYFNCPPQSDSLQPVISFCEKDIEHLIKTLKWK